MTSLSLLPIDIVDKHILPFLSAEEIYHLHATNTEMKARIRERRPFFVSRAQQRPTKMGIIPWGSDCGVSIQQLQRFRFIVQTHQHGAVWLEMTLANRVWDERHNERSFAFHPIHNRPCRTFVYRIDTPFFKYENQSTEEDLYDTDEGPCEVEDWLKSNRWPCREDPYDEKYYPTTDSDSDLEDNWQYQRKKEEWKNKHKSVEEKVQCVVKCIELCAKHLSSVRPFRGHALPCANYIVQDLPEYFHSHFPMEMVATKARDRVTTVDWDYRPAPSVETWWRYMLASDEPVVLNLNQLPWYRRKRKRS